MSDKNGIAAIAAKFQDRASQLASEQATLDVNRERLREAQCQLEHEEIQHTKARREMLTCVCTHHTAELDRMALEEQVETKKRCIEQSRWEVKELQSKLEQMRRRIEDQQSNYTGHIVETELFRRIFEGEIRRNKEEAEKREQTLVQILRESEQAQRDMDDINRQIDILVQEQRPMEEKAEIEDEEITAIGMQIKATLAKKRSLRAAVNQAQEKLQTSQDSEKQSYLYNDGM